MGMIELVIIGGALLVAAILIVAAKVARVRTEVEDLFERIEREYPQSRTNSTSGRKRDQPGPQRDRATGDLRRLTEAVTEHRLEQPEREKCGGAADGETLYRGPNPPHR